MGGPMRVGGKSHLLPTRAGQHFSTFSTLGTFSALQQVSLPAPGPLLTAVLRLLEYPCGGARVCGQPVEVFFGKRFG